MQPPEDVRKEAEDVGIVSDLNVNRQSEELVSSEPLNVSSEPLDVSSVLPIRVLALNSQDHMSITLVTRRLGYVRLDICKLLKDALWLSHVEVSFHCISASASK